MAPAFDLIELTPEAAPVLERLWQLYRHDLSEFRDSHPDEQGLFKPGRLPPFLGGDPDLCGYVFEREGRPVGFALVGGLTAGPRRVDEFFVVRSVRRTGLGQAAAEKVLTAHPGRWRIGFQNENPGAARFWRRLAAELGSDVAEEGQPVPGKPHIPPDVFLSFTVVS